MKLRPKQPSQQASKMRRYCGPVSHAELRLAGLVTQCLLGKPCEGPSTEQAEQVQIAFFHAPPAFLRGVFVVGIVKECHQIQRYRRANAPYGKPFLNDAPSDQGDPCQHQQKDW